MSPDIVVNYHQAFSTCSCSTLQPACAGQAAMQSEQRSSDVFIHLKAKLAPALPSLHMTMPQHICSDASHRAKHCRFFFNNTKNDFGELVEYPEGGGCKHHLSWHVFFCQEHWHMGPNHSVSRSAAGIDAPVKVTCENLFLIFYILEEKVSDVFCF